MSDLDNINDDVPEIVFEEVPPGQKPPAESDGSPSGGTSDSDHSEPSSSSGSPSPSPSSSDSDPLAAISEGFKELGEVLKEKQTVVPQQPLVQQKGETDEEFAERLKEQLFSENPLPALKEAIQRFTQPAVSQANYATLELAKRVIKLDPEKGPVFKKYEKEIDDYIKTLPPNVQANPGVYDYAYKEIYARHVDDIINERLKQKEEELKAELEAKYKGKSVDSPHMVGEPTVRAKAKKRVYYTAEEKTEAARKGIPLEDYLRIKGRL